MNNAVREELVCSKCGAEIREGALFCYGCGLAVAEITAPAVAALTAVDPALERAHEAAAAPVVPAGRRRRKPLKADTRVVEVEWTEPEGGTRALVVGTALIFAAALVLIFLGLYFK